MELPPHHKVEAQLLFQTPTDCANMPALTAKPVASASFPLHTHSPPAMPTATALPLRQGKHSNAFVAPEVRLNKTAAEEN